MAFFIEISKFDHIGDLNPLQVGWVEGRGWVLFDLDEPVLLNKEGVVTTLQEIFYDWGYSGWLDYVDQRVLEQVKSDFNNYIATQFTNSKSCSSILAH